MPFDTSVTMTFCAGLGASRCGRRWEPRRPASSAAACTAGRAGLLSGTHNGDRASQRQAAGHQRETRAHRFLLKVMENSLSLRASYAGLRWL
jgi:hypothetical protein